MQYAPVVYVSALTKQRIHRLPEVINYVAEQNAMRVATSVLNQVIADAVAINPPPTEKGQRLKIFRMQRRLKVKPPTFVIFGQRAGNHAFFVPALSGKQICVKRSVLKARRCQ